MYVQRKAVKGPDLCLHTNKFPLDNLEIVEKFTDWDRL